MRYTIKETQFFKRTNWRISIDEKGDPNFTMLAWTPNKEFAEFIVSHLPPPDQFPRPTEEIPAA